MMIFVFWQMLNNRHAQKTLEHSGALRWFGKQASVIAAVDTYMSSEPPWCKVEEIASSGNGDGDG